MILSKDIEISISSRNITKYKLLGYDCEIGIIVRIDIKHANIYSRSIILAECDICGNKKNIKYKTYSSNISTGNFFSCSKKCASKKSCITNFEKYGESHPMKSDEIKEKVRKVNLEKWGVENPFQNEEIKERIKKTNLEKWGVENPSNNLEIKEKIKSTNIERWGVDQYFKSDDFKLKVKKTFMRNYKNGHPMRTDEIKEKVRKTNLEKWGVDSILKSIEIRRKSRKTNLEKWGVEYYTNREKAKKTNLEKWGVEYYTNKEKAKKTNLEKWGVDHPMKDKEHRSRFKVANDLNYIKYLIDNISLFKCDCNKDHEFEITSSMYSDRKRYNIPLCTICNPIGSRLIKEKELYKSIDLIYDKEIIQSYRDNLEIDIYLPNLKLGFEFNGVWWHSEKYRDKWYHINKTNYFKERGIRIIHIWEDDWDFKRNIIESQIKNWLGLTENKIWARKCQVKEINNSKIVTEFLNENHIQGTANSNLKLGLYLEDELVSLMTLDHFEGRKKMEVSGWNINRFCNKLNYNVVGGASKLFKHFIKNYEVNRVVSYADQDWSQGDLYEKLGFEKLSEGNPDYKYIIEGKRIHKSKFRKSKTGISESKLDINKIWDCGKIKYQLLK